MSPIDIQPIYKIVARAEWEASLPAGSYTGSADDMRDGFIHLSTGQQLAATARKHFAGQENLFLIAVDVRGLDDALRWEPSRGGALFPHLYAPLPTAAALWCRPLPLDRDGVPMVAETLCGTIS